MLEQPEPLGLQPGGAEGGKEIAQTLRPVNEGKASPVFQQPPGGGAPVLQGAVPLHPGGPAAAAAPRLEVGRVGDRQGEAPGGEGFAHGAEISGANRPLQAVFRQVLAGQGGVLRAVFHTGEGQWGNPGGQQQEQRPRPAAQVAHPVPPPHRGKGGQGQAVAPQGEAGVRLAVHIGPQPLRRSHGVPSSRRRVMRPVRPQMARPSQA